MRLVILLALVGAALQSSGQVFRLTREQLIKYTAKNPFERFPDGRPKVPDALLDRVKTMSVEEAWTVLRSKGYHNQFAGGFRVLHPGQKLIGRAVTAQYLPARPDFEEITVVLRGSLRVEHEGGTLDVRGGQAVVTHPGEWVRYSSPEPGGAEYVAICLPAFSIDAVHRDDR